MANVRYTSGGSSATLGTKTIDENGIYNAVDDDLDGYSQVTVDVPAPSGAVDLSYTANGSYSENIEQYQTAEITVDVPIPTVNTQSKTVTATTSQQIVTPDVGYDGLEQVTVNPQVHTQTYTPNSDTAANDMGPVNNYRYVNTSGMINPAGTLEVEYTTNGPHTESVRQYDDISIDIDVPVSGDLGTKTITVNGTYNAIDDNLDGYSEVDVNVPQNATLGIKTITNNGNYYATADGYDGFSRVDVNVAGSTLQANKNVTATTSQQIVTPDVGYDGLEQVTVNPQVHTQTYTPAADTAANDMGAQNNYRYVDTSGMVIPGSVTPSNSSPAALTSGSAVTPTDNGYAIRAYEDKTPLDSDPPRVYNGGIYKIATRNGYLYATQQVTPTNITPSDSSPVALTADTPVNPTTNGYAIRSYDNVTPVTVTGSYVNQNSIYKITGSSGYVYPSQIWAKPGVATLSANSNNNIICGFKPKYIAYSVGTTGNVSVYNQDVSTTQYKKCSSSGIANTNIGTTSSYNLVSLNDDGFTVRGASSSATMYYFAIG